LAGLEGEGNSPDRGVDSLNCAPDSAPRERNGSAGAADGSEAQTNCPERFADNPRDGTESSEHGADSFEGDEDGL
jgi:hypothetical protein